jgi:hypothetical protein
MASSLSPAWARERVVVFGEVAANYTRRLDFAKQNLAAQEFENPTEIIQFC